MPELPEVETIRRQLEPEIVGRRIERLEVLDPRWSRPIAARGAGALPSPGAGSRRSAAAASTCCCALDGDETLVMHLRMTGNLLLRDGER